MCGIVGMVAARGAPPPRVDRIEQAVTALTHRGPDGTGFYTSPSACLGHTRLSIIDLERGDQPMTNEDGSIIVVYNGEIWNYRELRSELEAAGHRFRTHSDTEVLVHGYEEWADEVLTRLSGMFAFALWNTRTERLLLARDRVGKKPLYLARTRDGIAFGSDARSALIAAGLRPELDERHVPEFLFQRYVGAPRTLFRGVEKLPPGQLLAYDRTMFHQRPYWQVEAGAPERLQPEELRDLLRESVRRRLMSDVPLGVLLSGGVDSAAVLGLMNEIGVESVSTFTVGFLDPLYDERPAARLSASRVGAEHHEMVLSADEFLGGLPRLAWFRDEPIAEPSEVPLLLLAEFAGRHVRVVLTGDGGDELFGGYPKYRAERFLRVRGPVPHALQLIARLRARRPSHRRLGRAAESVGIRDSLLRWASWFRSFSPSDLQTILTPELRPDAEPERLVSALSALLAPYSDLDPGRRMLVGDLLTYLPDNMLLRSDKVLMAASVEGRMPLLDRDIVDRLSNVPASQRASLRAPKAILRAAVADLVPRAVLQQPKRGFPVPVARFLLDDANRSLERVVGSDQCLSRGLYEPQALRDLVEGVGPGRLDRELKLFTVASLELWLRTNVDELRLAPPRSEEVLGELMAGDIPADRPIAPGRLPVA
jgi:asparagine synthase (glutamine-hydrolysing)